MRILLVRFSSLGDCVLLCPLVEHFKRAGADEVVVLTKRAYAGLFASARGADRVVAVDGGGPAELWRTAREFRGSGHAVVDAHGSARSRIVALAAGRCDARIDKHTRARLGLILLKRPASLPTMLERYAQLARALGIDTPALQPGGIDIPEPARAAAAGAMAGGTFVAVSPGSRWPSKQWPGFPALCDALARAGDARILLVGDGRDRAAAAPIAAALGGRCLDLTGRATLLETAAHIARCRAFVGNDSGLMHLAEATGVPVVALFGPTVREFGYYPSLAQSRTIERRIACRPCSKNGSAPCVRGTGECLTAIRPESVVHAVTTLFDDAAPRRIVLD